ncbi:unnamed protein product [Leuciscus chuanchicus]
MALSDFTLWRMYSGGPIRCETDCCKDRGFVKTSWNHAQSEGYTREKMQVLIRGWIKVTARLKDIGLRAEHRTAHKTLSLHRSNPGSNQQSPGPHGKWGSPTEMGTRGLGASLDVTVCFDCKADALLASFYLTVGDFESGEQTAVLSQRQCPPPRLTLNIVFTFLKAESICGSSCQRSLVTAVCREPKHMAKWRPCSEWIRMRVDSLCLSASQRYSTRSTQSRHDLSQRWETNTRTIPDGKLTTQGMQRMTQHSASYVMVNLERSSRDDITAKVSSHPAMGRGVNQSDDSAVNT